MSAIRYIIISDDDKRIGDGAGCVKMAPGLKSRRGAAATKSAFADWGDVQDVALWEESRGLKPWAEGDLRVAAKPACAG